MKISKKYYVVFCLLITVIIACKKLINTPVTNTSYNYLVVNGFINSGDTTTINLSRTVKLSDSVGYVPELNATVSIEGSQSGTYNLLSAGKGNYKSAPVTLSSGQNYRLKIITGNGKQYVSDYVPVKNSPPIDSISYVAGATGVQINANTHDASNITRYYKWDYKETYIIHSAYYSHYIVVNHDTTAVRSADQQIYQCWASDTSSSIVLGSSAALSKDVISSQAITLVPSTSDKIHIRYSILVNQLALTADAFNYYQQLQKNTEQIGTIFDAQPSALSGNIYCVNTPSEIVIGYITAGAATQSRIFIDSSNLPHYTVANNAPCPLDTLLYRRVIIFPTGGGSVQREVHDLIYPGNQIPVDKVGDYPTGGFSAAFPMCVDCTLRGTNKQPTFWK
jgi:hypothetical protein